MIGYLIINNSYKKDEKYTRLRKSAEPYTDHYLVLVKIKIKTGKQVYTNSRREKNTPPKKKNYKNIQVRRKRYSANLYKKGRK